MRRVLMGLGAALLVTLVTAPSADAQIVHMTAKLSGANEVPGVVTGAGGTATVTVDVTRQTVSYVIDVFNMPSGLTAAHFHAGGPGVAGPVVANITITPTISNDFTVTGSVSSITVRDAQGIRSLEDFIQALVGEQLYINFHSAANPGGEIRGQVLRVVP
ncbi:MAG: CHRD domain-containing protein [Acidobacteriota bacterium]